MMDGWGMSGWGWAWMTLLMVLGILLFALLALMLLRSSASGPAPEDQRDDPARILASRLARGEIDEEEYRRRLGVLRAADGTPPDHAATRPEGTRDAA